jgi:hypothetical protein
MMRLLSTVDVSTCLASYDTSSAADLKITVISLSPGKGSEVSSFESKR